MGVTLLVLFLMVLVVFVAIGGSSYARARRRRLLRTAPVLMVHSPPDVSTTLTTHSPPAQQTPVIINTTSYPWDGSDFEDCPPPYSTVAETPAGYEVLHCGGSRIFKGGVPLSRTFSTALMRAHEAGDTCAHKDKKGGSEGPKEPPWIRHCPYIVQRDSFADVDCMCHQ